MMGMTRSMKTLAVIGLMLLLSPICAMAQGTTPTPTKKGSMAVSGNLGFTNAFDDDFDGLNPVLDGTFEYYFTDRFSLRGLLGYTSFEADHVDVEVDVIILNANALYYWESGALRPFVTGGVGFYDTDPSGSDIHGGGDTEIGFNCGGGLDIFVQRDWAIKVEGTFHGFSSDGPDSFFSATVGAKFQF